MFERWLKRGAQPHGRERQGSTHLIELRQAVKTYQSAAGSFTALKGVDLRVDRGEFVAIIGKSGSGKSTLINMITGIDRPTSGEVLVGDTAVPSLSEGQIAAWRGRNLGVIFQFFQLLPSLSIVENVMLPMDFCNMYHPRERRERAMQLLAQIEMDAQAQGEYKRAAGSVTKADIAAARANLTAAQSRLAALQAGHTGAHDAELALQRAQTQLQSRRDQLSAAKTDAQLQMEQRVHDLTMAQSAYATALQNWRYVQDTGRDPANVALNPKTGKQEHLKLNDVQRQHYHDALVQSEAAMHSAEVSVQQAQVAYDAARQAEARGVQAAEQDVASVQAQLDALRGGGDAQQLAAAHAQVAAALADLNRLTGASRSGDLASAQANVAIAEAGLAQLTADPDVSALAQAAVARAELAVKAAQQAIDQATLTAPFDGTIAALDLKVREYVAPGTPIARLADSSAWQIETADLTELNVANIRAGTPATISFDALPGVSIAGTVTHVKGFGENRQGDIVYTVTVAPDQWDARLRWNMTASVSIAAR